MRSHRVGSKSHFGAVWQILRLAENLTVHSQVDMDVRHHVVRDSVVSAEASRKAEAVALIRAVQALAPLGRRCEMKRDGGLKLRKAWSTQQPQQLSSRALFGPLIVSYKWPDTLPVHHLYRGASLDSIRPKSLPVSIPR